MYVTTITLHIIRIQLNESSMIRLRRDCGLVKIIIMMFISHMLMVLMGVAIVAHGSSSLYWLQQRSTRGSFDLTRS